MLPDVFSDSSVFESFTNAVGDEKQEIINQLHKVLKPFILRRLKKEGSTALPELQDDEKLQKGRRRGVAGHRMSSLL